MTIVKGLKNINALVEKPKYESRNKGPLGKTSRWTSSKDSFR
jgi:hypothetical protein